ncbi:MBOAT, membrane-bound O-acyltransferase family-domain-containing protein [Zopfochytrium polystomum]|nr:MBOAT, membrane-bound O-acyltransferase family-domain-containing protein [Zopfochytrium polystomum]
MSTSVHPPPHLHQRPPHVLRTADADTSASESELQPHQHRPLHPSSLSKGARKESGFSSATAGQDGTDGGYTSTASVDGAQPGGKRRQRKPRFEPRVSKLDFESIDQNPLHGFFMLAFMGLVWYIMITMYHSLVTDGVPIRLRLFFSISHDSYNLAVSDGFLILSCAMPVLFQKLILYRVIPLDVAYIVQHVWQGVWFGTIVFWTFYRDWPWTQTGFFTLHGISMLMKQHSYMATNTDLHYKHRDLKKKEAELALLRSAGKSGAAEETSEAAAAREARIVSIMSDCEGLRAELTRSKVQFPNNINFFNWVDYMLVPTLVYDLEYPRTKSFRPLYFLEKVAATFFTFGLLYITVEHYIYPVLALTRKISFLSSLMYLIIPFMVCYMLIFYIIFECICNAFAELTFFADREFYDDWWNSTTFDEYARKWNKPVHEFLLRHVYLETIASLKMSKQNATLLTFFVSSCFHEVVMAVTGKRIRMYLFGLQMFQIPLIYFARIPFVRKQKTFGNALFWFGMFLGPPLLGVAYSREHWWDYLGDAPNSTPIML